MHTKNRCMTSKQGQGFTPFRLISYEIEMHYLIEWFNIIENTKKNWDYTLSEMFNSVYYRQFMDCHHTILCLLLWNLMWGALITKVFR